jgi:hypothetical protein
MSQTARRILTATLIALSFSANATVVVSNDWLSTDLDAWLYEDDVSNVLSSNSNNYTGAATSRSDSADISGFVNFRSADATSLGNFSVGSNISTAISSTYANTIFSGWLRCTDEGSSIASGVLETTWTFTSTNYSGFNLTMFNENEDGAGEGYFSFSLFDDETDSLIAYGANSFYNSISGILSADTTYRLQMTVDRESDFLENLGDGTTHFNFSVADEFLLAEDRTHTSIPSPSITALFCIGLIGIGISHTQARRRGGGG